MVEHCQCLVTDRVTIVLAFEFPLLAVIRAENPGISAVRICCERRIWLLTEGGGGGLADRRVDVRRELVSRF